MKKIYLLAVLLLTISLTICKADGYQSGFVILKNGKRVGGQIKLYKNAPWKNQRFIWFKDSAAVAANPNAKPKKLYASDMKFFQAGSRQFVKVTYVDQADLKLRNLYTNSWMLERVSNGRFVAYMYYSYPPEFFDYFFADPHGDQTEPAGNDNAMIKYRIIFKKDNAKHFVNAYTYGLATYFKDTPQILQKYSDGAYGNQPDVEGSLFTRLSEICNRTIFTSHAETTGIIAAFNDYNQTYAPKIEVPTPTPAQSTADLFKPYLFKGTIIDNDTHKGVTDATVSYIDSATQQVVKQTSTDSTGSYVFNVTDKRPFGIKVEKKGFFTQNLTGEAVSTGSSLAGNLPNGNPSVGGLGNGSGAVFNGSASGDGSSASGNGILAANGSNSSGNGTNGGSNGLGNSDLAANGSNGSGNDNSANGSNGSGNGMLAANGSNGSGNGHSANGSNGSGNSNSSNGSNGSGNSGLAANGSNGSGNGNSANGSNNSGNNRNGSNGSGSNGRNGSGNNSLAANGSNGSGNGNSATGSNGSGNRSLAANGSNGSGNGRNGSNGSINGNTANGSNGNGNSLNGGSANGSGSNGSANSGGSSASGNGTGGASSAAGSLAAANGAGVDDSGSGKHLSAKYMRYIHSSRYKHSIYYKEHMQHERELAQQKAALGATGTSRLLAGNPANNGSGFGNGINDSASGNGANGSGSGNGANGSVSGNGANGSGSGSGNGANGSASGNGVNGLASANGSNGSASGSNGSSANDGSGSGVSSQTLAVSGKITDGKFISPNIRLQAYSVNKPMVVNNVLYDYGYASLRPESIIVLDGLAKKMIDNPNIFVELSAHTDSIGSDAYNLKLSQDRAQACVNYIIGKGVDATRITAVGYGKSKPIAPNSLPNGQDNPDGRQLNRRTEFVVRKNDKAVSELTSR